MTSAMAAVPEKVYGSTESPRRTVIGSSSPMTTETARMAMTAAWCAVIEGARTEYPSTISARRPVVNTATRKMVRRLGARSEWNSG